MKLEKKAGKSIKLTCQNCDEQNTHILNSVKAKEGKAPIFLSALIVLATLVLVYVLNTLGYIGSGLIYKLIIIAVLVGGGVTIYTRLAKTEKNNVLRFNHYKLKEKV